MAPNPSWKDPANKRDRAGLRFGAFFRFFLLSPLPPERNWTATRPPLPFSTPVFRTPSPPMYIQAGMHGVLRTCPWLPLPRQAVTARRRARRGLFPPAKAPVPSARQTARERATERDRHRERRREIDTESATERERQKERLCAPFCVRRIHIEPAEAATWLNSGSCQAGGAMHAIKERARQNCLPGRTLGLLAPGAGRLIRRIIALSVCACTCPSQPAGLSACLPARPRGQQPPLACSRLLWPPHSPIGVLSLAAGRSRRRTVQQATHVQTRGTRRNELKKSTTWTSCGAGTRATRAAADGGPALVAQCGRRCASRLRWRWRSGCRAVLRTRRVPSSPPACSLALAGSGFVGSSLSGSPHDFRHQAPLRMAVSVSVFCVCVCLGWLAGISVSHRALAYAVASDTNQCGPLRQHWGESRGEQGRAGRQGSGARTRGGREGRGQAPPRRAGPGSLPHRRR